MNTKNLCLFFTLFLLSFSTAWAQTEMILTGAIEVASSDGVVDISPAELQSLMEQLMQFKKKRQQQMALVRQQQNIYTRPLSSPPGDLNMDRRLDEMEKLLLQMNDRLAQIQESNKQYTPVTSIPQQPFSLSNTNKQDTLLTNLQEELLIIRKAVQDLSLNPPIIKQVNSFPNQDTTAQNDDSDFYLTYATEMMALRRSVDSLDRQLEDLVDKSDFVALEKQLTRIEERMQSPLLQRDENDTPIVQNSELSTTDSKAYMDAQFKEVRQLIGELKTNKNQTDPVAISPSVDLENSQTLAKQEAQIQELNRQVSELKRTLSQDRETIVLTNPEPSAPISEALLLAQQSAQFEALSRQIEELKTSNNSPREIIVETPPVANSENEELKAQLAELRAMIAQIQPGSHTLKEKVITVAAKPDTSYNWLKRIITGKEKRQLLYENNAVKITDEHRIALLETVSMMNQYGELDLSIDGFTSPTGSPAYNKSLSQSRAENVKKYLMQQGIHPSRLFTEYHGIDYQVSNPAQGRRVDLVMMIRRY